MMDSFENFYKVGDGILLIAPPGWGKTYKLLKWAKKSEFSFVYLSPLRALSEEIYLNSSKEMSGVLFPRTRHEFLELFKNNVHFKFLITSFEIFDLSLLKNEELIFVLDEFHLIYHWGEDFREKLKDIYRELFSLQKKVLLLTATMKKENERKLMSHVDLNYNHFYKIDLGNHQLKNIPQKIFYYPSFFKNKLIKNLELELALGVPYTILLFCKYRLEVDFYREKFKEYTPLLTCKGGETEKFCEELKEVENPKLIISTSTLSHGVNLPKISRIYFSKPIQDLDFYIQMIGRGGRRGEDYIIHSRERINIKNFISLLFFNLFLRVRYIIHLFKAF